MNDQKPTNFLSRLMARPWFLTLWCVLAAFGSYMCMYGFRKPYTAAGFGSEEAKAWLVTAQVLGYALSKIIGIKVIAEMTGARRARTLLGILIVAEISLGFFAIIPPPFDAACLFLNGLSLGMVFGLVLGFIEGRRLTELFVAGLCASFIVADGFSKSVGVWLLQAGVAERAMPSVAGLVFLIPLLLFIWMLSQIPAPTLQDEEARSQRTPMTSARRIDFFRRHGIGLIGIMLAYLFITVLRSIRADFAPEIWAGFGFKGQPALFTQSELWVTLVVVSVSGAIVLVKNNKRAFFAGLGLAIMGTLLALLALCLRVFGDLPPFVFMVLLGVGMYVPYVVVHTTLFERFIALTRERGNMGFLMYVADSVGYLGYVAVMLGRGFFPKTGNFFGFFSATATVLMVAAMISLIVSFIVYARRNPAIKTENVEVGRV